MVRLLHIETATKVCSVALSENGKVVKMIEENSEEYSHSEKLTLFISRALEMASWNLNDLNAVAITGGPGSYTGLRIGVSVAKGICYALNIPLISVGALDCLYGLAKNKYPDFRICAMLDARRMEVFSKIYDKDGAVLKDLSADVLDANSYAEFEPFIACGDGAKKMLAFWEKRNISFDVELLSSASGQIETAHAKYLNHDFEDLAYYEPKYLKDFVVTKPKRKVF
ncbi:MAG: tRNA (adenosine(37)-N6)-threonylcarbamoyltransferase complex dimerization subunit type 1 TsaB [Brumimicrobium sp.]|nr:tRNA (adenosine(37)-N6)-threonylcarbamoyltransferase complex dimerization subunit type 1 TsaB [Brumimicrobium sp.]